MANQPSLIPSAWAANNSTTETIPATTTESGKASWDQGFPVETSLPLSEGGIPPKYGDFNGILNVLSQFCLFAQSGGQYAWVNSLDYSVGSIVLGTDGSIYRAAQVSGPSTTAVNPVGDTSGKWERIVSQSDINALEQEISDAMDAAEDAASNASAAQSAVTTLDANVVKLSGSQTVGGVKTFSSETHHTNAGTWCRVYNLNTTKGTYPTGNNVNFWNPYCDKNGNNFAAIEVMLWTDGSVWNRLYVFENKASDGGSVYVESGFDTASSSTMFRPSTNGTTSLGSGGRRWGQIYSSNSTISTSDERTKSNITSIPDAVLDAWGDVNWSQFQFNNSIEKKGADKARLHNGLIAQRIDAVFKVHGLDVSKYGLFCYDEWDATPAEHDEDGNIRNPAKEAGNLYSIRYEEALAMEAAYQRRCADRAEARISALEQRLNEMEAVLASLMSPVEVEAEDLPYVAQEQDAEQEGEE